jgi:UPF0755 protein
LKAGEFSIKPGDVFYSLIQDIEQGKEYKYKLTIVPGMNWRQLDDTIQQLPLTGMEDIAQFDTPSLEGYFYPDTYLFNKNTKVKHIFNQARARMESLVSGLYSERDAALSDFTLDEIITIASIIEREAAMPDERPKVSRVIYNRLARRMPLQIDATTVYDAINQDKVFHAAMLKIDSPYNTYMRPGIPPGPIAYPSESSVYAAVHPADGKWLYYRLYCGKQHMFTESFEQHTKVLPCLQP